MFFISQLPAFSKPKPDAELLNARLPKALERQGEWLIKHQKQEGDFVYEMEFGTGKLTDDNNIVRQAGALYALTQYQRASGNKEAINSIEKGISYFKSLTQEVTVGSAINYQNNILSNTNALLVLALVEYIEANDDVSEKHLEYLTNLSDYLVDTQDESGNYIYQTVDGTPVYSDYNNGESLNALIRAYRVTGNEVYLKSAELAADKFIQTYGKQEFNTSFFCWGVAGFYHLLEIKGDEKYWDFMKDYTDKYMVFTGEYYDAYILRQEGVQPNPKAFVYQEGVIHIVAAAKQKDPALYEELKNHTTRVLRYNLGYEINAPYSAFKSQSQELSGAICYTAACETTRVDMIQHSISAMYLYKTLITQNPQNDSTRLP